MKGKVFFKKDHSDVSNYIYKKEEKKEKGKYPQTQDWLLCNPRAKKSLNQ